MEQQTLRSLKATPPNPNNNVYQFQVTDVKVVDYVPSPLGVGVDPHGQELLDSVEEGDKFPRRAKQCSVLLFGVTESGSSILIRVTDFSPSLYYRARGDSWDTFRSRLVVHLKRTFYDIEPSDLRIEIRKMKHMYGWEPNSHFYPTDRKDHTYYQVYFPTLKHFWRATKAAKEDSHDIPHECKISPEFKFMDEVNVSPSEWALVSGGTLCEEDDKISHCATEIKCSKANILPYVTNNITGETPKVIREKSNRIAPYMIANLDIECVSAKHGFPEADQINDIVISVGIVYWRYGTSSDEAVHVSHVVGQCEPVDGIIVHCYDTEKEMLAGVRRELVLVTDPDIVSTYNGSGFDLPYLCARAELLGCAEFMFLDRIVKQKCKGMVKELSSAALGSNDMFVIKMCGRSHLDLYHWIKARKKLESYKLDDVAEHFLNERKIPMAYKDLFRFAQTPDGRAKIVYYCAQDCFLLVGLMQKLQIIPANTEMSRVAFVPMEMLVTRGQQIKVLHQLIHYGHRMGSHDKHFNGGYVMNEPTHYSGGEDDGYEGATVIDAKKKYYKEPIAVLDFMSLYPSIMLANNFCMSNLVQNEECKNIPGVHYVTVRVTSDKEYTWAVGTLGTRWKTCKSPPAILIKDDNAVPSLATLLANIHREEGILPEDEVFTLPDAYTSIDNLKLGDVVCSRDAEGNEFFFEPVVVHLPGVLQKMLVRMLDERTVAKRLKADATDADSKAVYDGRQQALKVSANSMYGFTGVSTKWGYYPCLAVADCVTCRAREMLNRTVVLVQQFADCEVVYGDTDSVMVRFSNVTSIQEAFKMGDGAAEWITTQFWIDTQTKNIVLEMEKVYMPYMLRGKKQYAALMYTKDKQGDVVYDHLDAKGIQLVRRDNCPLAKKAQQCVLDELLHNMNPVAAVTAVREILSKIVGNEYEMDQYKMSKSLRKDYKSEQLPHVFVKNKMDARDKGSAPQVGDRVPYVLLETTDRQSKAWQKAEDPGYAEKHGLLIDRLYYVEHQIISPVTSFLDLVEEIPDPLSIFQPYINDLRRQRERNVDIRTMLIRGSSSQTTDVGKSQQPPKKLKRTKDVPHFSMNIKSMLKDMASSK